MTDDELKAARLRVEAEIRRTSNRSIYMRRVNADDEIVEAIGGGLSDLRALRRSLDDELRLRARR